MAYESEKHKERITARYNRDGERYQVKYRFPNGYGASVVRGKYTYGGDEGFYKLAVLDEGDDIAYDTPITSDVLGWLDEAAVDDALAQIAALNPQAIAMHRIALSAQKAHEILAQAAAEFEQAQRQLLEALDASKSVKGDKQ
jgi:hypothetical protein